MISNFYKCIFIFGILISNHARAQQQLFPVVTKTTHVSIVYNNKGVKLDSIAANLLADDIERVTSFRPVVLTNLAKAKGNVIVIGSIQSTLIKKLIGIQSAFVEKLHGKWESFGLTM